MSRFPLDRHGIPLLSSAQIESKAEEVIEYFDPKVLKQPGRTPVMFFMDQLVRKFNVKLDCGRDLGNTPEGHKILGMFCFQPTTILVDKSLLDLDDYRLYFTLGHEFGHLVFHRDITVKKKGYSDADISDTARNFVTGRKVLLTPRDWLVPFPLREFRV